MNDAHDTLLMDLLEPEVWLLVQKVIGRMGGIVKRAKKLGPLHGYEMHIDGGHIDFHMGTQYSLDVSYKDPDFFEKLEKELEKRVLYTIGLNTWPKYTTVLSKEKPFTPKNRFKHPLTSP